MVIVSNHEFSWEACVLVLCVSSICRVENVLLTFDPIMSSATVREILLQLNLAQSVWIMCLFVLLLIESD